MIVFVVDDEPIIASTLELILRAKGFDARSFVNPIDALQVAQSVAPHILISDVMMPEMNGFDLAIHVTTLHPSCKALMVSGQTATGDLFLAVKARGYKFDVLPKPVHPDELLQKIEELIGN
ncbi:MAG TPA: response regulator [Terracidiphilus sp.]|nr:response regulator [Terracidiphilus sp.]